MKTTILLDQIGSPETDSLYPMGWSLAGNTPFKKWKQDTRLAWFYNKLRMTLMPDHLPLDNNLPVADLIGPRHGQNTQTKHNR